MRYTFAIRLEVRFRDCDPMGHVNHAVYFTYLEQARFAYWRDMLGRYAATPASIILVRAECDYRSQARHTDMLEVQIRVEAVGRSSFTLGCAIVHAAEARQVATARSVHVTYDYGAQKPIPIPDDIRAALEQERLDGLMTAV